ncbi:MAG: hypothetical protein ACRDJP_02305, partial [Actinomycetota bacterium]
GTDSDDGRLRGMRGAGEARRAANQAAELADQLEEMMRSGDVPEHLHRLIYLRRLREHIAGRDGAR